MITGKGPDMPLKVVLAIDKVLHRSNAFLTVVESDWDE